jgi:WD40 repeat protein
MYSLRQTLIRSLFSLSFLMGCSATLPADAPVTAVALAPDGQQLLIGSQRGIEIQSWPELAAVSTLPTKLVHVHDLRFSPDGKQLLAAGGSPAEGGEVEVWSWPQGKLLATVADHSDVVYRVAWSPQGTRWASCGGDARCFVYTAASEKPVAYEGHSRPVSSILWLDERTLASVGIDQTVRLWNADTGAHLRTLDNHVGSVNDLAPQPGAGDSTAGPAVGVLATVGEDRTVRLWQPGIGRLMRFGRLASPPRSVIWSADSTRLLVGCSDGMIRIIDWESMEPVAEISGGVGRIHELALDSGLELLLVAGERGCRTHHLKAAAK